ncbi:hypothetical protein BKA70DRAFT_1442648 [Coprinopsis sp. MPI-PUGE-AT-0042]|nr:hypothetical protein BKA70DRAFT_1442648 [Coprinopsis sp. MPI-PUGE-AT-0042]
MHPTRTITGFRRYIDGLVHVGVCSISAASKYHDWREKRNTPIGPETPQLPSRDEWGVTSRDHRLGGCHDASPLRHDLLARCVVGSVGSLPENTLT